MHKAARLAQSVEHQTFNLRVKGSSPLSGLAIFLLFLIVRSTEVLIHFFCIVYLTVHQILNEKEKKYLSEVGFEPTPTEVDCDLNAAP